MKPVSYALAASLVFAAIFAIAPHRGIAEPVTPAAVVETKDFAYAADTVTIKAGEAVLFKNSDSVGHTVAADDKSFDSGDMPTGATWLHTFEKPGTYAYYCAYHRYMHGKIIVK
jgi:plastocyanin